MRIDPKLLIDFAAIAEEGSFTRAAQRLRVAQPWLSARINKLEDIIGFRLLDRTTRNVSLTTRGAEFLDAARGVANASNAANQLALQLKRGESGIIRIGAAPYTRLIHKRREIIQSFSTQFPNIGLEIETGWSLTLLRRLNSGEIDLAFLMGDVDPAQYDAQVLDQLGMAITVSHTHPFAEMDFVSPEMLSDRKIMVFTRSLYPHVWDLMYDQLRQAGAHFIEIPEMAEGPPVQMANDEVAAFFDFRPSDAGAVSVVQIPILPSPMTRFHLLRLRERPSRCGEAFWNLATKSATAGTST